MKLYDFWREEMCYYYQYVIVAILLYVRVFLHLP